MTKYFNYFSFDIFLDPFFDEFCSFIFLSGLYIFNNHIVEIVAQDLSNFVASLWFLSIFLFSKNIDIKFVIID